MIVSLLVFITIALLALPSAAILFPFTLLSGNVEPLYATGSWIARVAMCLARIHVRVQGQEKIPAGRACIFMANHISYLDAPALMTNLPGRTVVFIKGELMKLPILGYAFKLAHFIPVERTGDAAELFDDRHLREDRELQTAKRRRRIHDGEAGVDRPSIGGGP